MKISSGVFIIPRSGFIAIIPSTVIIRDIIIARIVAFPTVLRIAFISPAPNFCAVSTVNPAVMPTTNP